MTQPDGAGRAAMRRARLLDSREGTAASAMIGTGSTVTGGLPDMDGDLLAWRGWQGVPGRGALPKMHGMRAWSDGVVCITQN